MSTKEKSRNNDDTSNLIAEFVVGLDFEELPTETVEVAKRRLLDTLSCTIGAAREEEIAILRNTIASSPSADCTLVGSDLRASAPDAAMLNTSMSRNLDYMDSYIGPHGGGHPSNCVFPIIACSELVNGSTTNVLASLVAATEVLGAFADVINSRERSGIEHLGYVGIAMTAGAGKALDLNADQLREALSIMAASYNPLQVTRAETITMWKGFAAGYAALVGVNSVLMARNGMHGPHKAFDGKKGWKEVVARQDFELTFTRGKRIQEVLTKPYLAETYGLSAVEAAVELSGKDGFNPEHVASVYVKSFSDAVSRLAQGEGRDPYLVTTKPEADHSFPYMIAAALIDGDLSIAQYTKERILADDVQSLMKKIRIEADEELNRRFGDGHDSVPVEICVTMSDGTEYHASRDYFKGHAKQPASMEDIIEKVRRLAQGNMNAVSIDRLIKLVIDIEHHDIKQLAELLH